MNPSRKFGAVQHDHDVDVLFEGPGFLILGEGMRCGELLRAVEPIVGKPIL